ncbi:hypothetical protein KC992_03970 [Candidatus Saccharibacteria bacterium]|nr:hypothetical protein [Candidatus Saccharibacteria bacterium]MCA9328962.1 hypothetical protein [Candidatus Saccharibacteria bacterium]
MSNRFDSFEGKDRGEVLLIHGLGSWKSRLAIRGVVSALNLRIDKPKIHFFNPKWQTSELPQDKINRLVKFWKSERKPSIVIGISAGANLARYLALKNPDDDITEVHLFAGYTSNGNSIYQRHREEAPAFPGVCSIVHDQLRSKIEDQTKITQYVPTVDGNYSDDIISEPDMVLEGATTVLVPMNGHSASIRRCLLHELAQIAS